MSTYTARANVRSSRVLARETSFNPMTIRFESLTPPSASDAMRRFEALGYETNGEVKVRLSR